MKPQKIVLLQIVVAVVALVLTLALVLKIPPLVEKKAVLEKEKQELEAGIESLRDDARIQQDLLSGAKEETHQLEQRQSILEEHVAELNDQIMVQQSELDSFENRNNELAQVQEILENETKGLRSKMENLNNRLEESGNQILDLEERQLALAQDRTVLIEEIELLEVKKREMEKSFGHYNAALVSLTREANEQVESKIKGSITPRASAIPDPNGGSTNLTFKCWLEMPETVARRVASVSYEFNHPTFPERFLNSRDVSNRFEVSYGGWGCLPLVKIVVKQKSGDVDPIYFNMCDELNQSGAGNDAQRKQRTD